MRALALCLSLAFASPAAAHEFWIEPLEYTVAPDGTLQGELVNGQNFGGSHLSYIPQRFVRFDLTFDGTTVPAETRMGSRPALNMPAMGDGLHISTYVSTISRVGYADFAKFAKFVEHKDFQDVEARHIDLGFPQENFGEAYTRFAKTLIAVGSGAGDDQRMGLETEFVVLDNPYTSDAGTDIRVQLFYHDDVRANVQVEVFDKAPDESVEITLYRTDEQGIATLPVQAGHSYLVDAVVLRVADPELAANRDVVWETLWADLTFAVPE